MERDDAADYALFSEWLRYEPESGKLYWRKTPRHNKPMEGTIAGCFDNKGYRIVTMKDKPYKAHRIVWLLQYKCWPTKVLDHINGIYDDNRIENLRETDTRFNLQNRKEHRKGKLYGCSYHKHRKKWQANIRIAGKQTYLGLYDTEQEAHAAYQRALAKLTDSPSPCD